MSLVNIDMELDTELDTKLDTKLEIEVDQEEKLRIANEKIMELEFEIEDLKTDNTILRETLNEVSRRNKKKKKGCFRC